MHLDLQADGLVLALDGAAPARFPWLWLRDHGHDPDTLHPDTRQRQLDTAAVPADIRATAAAPSADGTAIEIRWSDGCDSRYPLAFLHRYASPRPADAPLAALPADPEDGTRLAWDRASIGAGPRISHDAVTGGDAGLRAWLADVQRWGFCIVEGTPATAAATEALIRRIGYIRETIFGGFWEFTAGLAKADTAYTPLTLRPHTDGTYSHDAPGLQMLHCLAFDGSGGNSVLVDGLTIAGRLRAEAPDHYDTLSRIPVPGQYIGDDAHLMAARPVFRHDAAGRLLQVSFNNYDRAPFRLPDDEMTAFYAALKAFEALANDPALQWVHRLAPGEALLFDNWRLLHGREAYQGRRRLCGAYLNREDFESRLRLLDVI